MAAGIVQDGRATRAAGIVERQELMLRDDGTWRVRDTAGSGCWHAVVDGHCSCADYVYRNVRPDSDGRPWCRLGARLPGSQTTHVAFDAGDELIEIERLAEDIVRTAL